MAKKYLVYVEQVNQACVEVTADNADDARAKGYAKWRREDAHSRVMAVEEVGSDSDCADATV